MSRCSKCKVGGEQSFADSIYLENIKKCRVFGFVSWHYGIGAQFCSARMLPTSVWMSEGGISTAFHDWQMTETTGE